MEKTIEAIKSFFEKLEWKYEYIEGDENQSIFASKINMNNALGRLRIFIIVRKDYYVVYTVLDNTVEEQYYNQVSEYLHRANYGMNNGNFEFDFDDGEIRFKTYVSFDGLDLSGSVIEDSILVPIFMFDKYGKNLLRLMLGEGSAKELLQDAESIKPTPNSD